MIFLKSEEEIEKIRRASDIVVEVLDRLSEETKPGVSTWDLDKIAEELTLKKEPYQLLKAIEVTPPLFASQLTKRLFMEFHQKKRY